jgi:hypothetical protein
MVDVHMTDKNVFCVHKYFLWAVFAFIRRKALDE